MDIAKNYSNGANEKEGHHHGDGQTTVRRRKSLKVLKSYDLKTSKKNLLCMCVNCWNKYVGESAAFMENSIAL